ncbi:MAG: hypothetical protein ACLFNW_03780 [Desulfobacterales bacterium]
MGVEFKTQDKVAKFLNPFKDFALSETKCQIRQDPLTARTGRLAHFVGFKPPSADFSKIIENSEQNCPFCPQNVFTMTPKFDPDQIPEGRLEKGESVLFPNLLPYDAHSALAVLCKKHYRDLTDFTPDIFRDAFENCIAYLERVLENKEQTYGLVTWNYMPAAGSSQVHPHFQVYGTQSPGNFLQNMLSAGKDYMQNNGRTYWEDYVNAETNTGQRLIAQNKNSIWLTDFVPVSALTDVVGIFPEKQTLFDLNGKELREAAQMINLAIDYLGQQGVYSLNMGWMPALKGEKHHWLQIRISPRLYLAPHVWCTETPSLVYQYQESFAIWSPEDTAKEINAFVKTAETKDLTR